jgi:hypothetical protein
MVLLIISSVVYGKFNDIPMYKQTNPHISSLLRFLQHVTEHFSPPPQEGDGEQTGGQTRSAR